MRKLIALPVGLALGTMLALPASAQNPQPAPPQVTHPPVASPSAPSPPPEKIAPKDTTLSDKLAQQQGTLKPPAVDPGMSKPVPRGTGSMPVIPPPGTPGGNQNVQPR